MSTPGRLVHLLRNTPVREITRALERDGFYISRNTRTGGLIYKHTDGRTVPIHPHSGGAALRRKTLASIVHASQWTEEDARRLGLL